MRSLIALVYLTVAPVDRLFALDQLIEHKFNGHGT